MYRKLVAAVIVLAVTFSMTACRTRTTSEKVSDAAHSAGRDVKRAAHDAGDAVKDAAHDVKDAVKDATN